MCTLNQLTATLLLVNLSSLVDLFVLILVWNMQKCVNWRESKPLATESKAEITPITEEACQNWVGTLSFPGLSSDPKKGTSPLDPQDKRRGSVMVLKGGTYYHFFGTNIFFLLFWTHPPNWSQRYPFSTISILAPP